MWDLKKPELNVIQKVWLELKKNVSHESNCFFLSLIKLRIVSWIGSKTLSQIKSLKLSQIHLETVNRETYDSNEGYFTGGSYAEIGRIITWRYVCGNRDSGADAGTVDVEIYVECQWIGQDYM